APPVAGLSRSAVAAQRSIAQARDPRSAPQHHAIPPSDRVPLRMTATSSTATVPLPATVEIYSAAPAAARIIRPHPHSMTLAPGIQIRLCQICPATARWGKCVARRWPVESRVAVKVVPSDVSTSRKRRADFGHEAQILARLEHRNGRQEISRE